MKKRLFMQSGLAVLTLLLVLGVSVAASGLHRSSETATAERADCPGKIECPLTGEQVCKDQCPLQESCCAGSSDTAEHSPQNASPTAEGDKELPACCRTGK